MAEHCLAQFAAVWVTDIEQLRAAVHGHGERFADKVGCADGGTGSQVAHAHRVPA